MSDTPTAAQDLGLAPAGAGATAPAPATPVIEGMDYDTAVLAKSQRLGDATWRSKYLAGDVGARAEMDVLARALSPRTPQPSDPASIESLVDHLRTQADLSEEVIAMVRENRAISPQERKLTESLKTRLFSDKAWVRKYLEGDREAHNTKVLIDINLSLPVATGE